MKPSAKQTRLAEATRRLTARLSGIRGKAMGLLKRGEDRERESALERIKKNIQAR